MYACACARVAVDPSCRASERVVHARAYVNVNMNDRELELNCKVDV